MEEMRWKDEREKFVVRWSLQIASLSARGIALVVQEFWRLLLGGGLFTSSTGKRGRAKCHRVIREKANR